MAKICEELMECAQHNTMLCVTDETGTIVGVCAGKADSNEKVFYVYDVLTIEPWALRQMLSEFLIRFPGYTLTGRRHNVQERQFNVPQLLERL